MQKFALRSVVPMIRKTQYTVCKYGIDDKPDSRKRYDNIRYDRAYTAVTHKNCRYKIKVEDPV